MGHRRGAAPHDSPAAIGSRPPPMSGRPFPVTYSPESQGSVARVVISRGKARRVDQDYANARAGRDLPAPVAPRVQTTTPSVIASTTSEATLLGRASAAGTTGSGGRGRRWSPPSADGRRRPKRPAASASHHRDYSLRVTAAPVGPNVSARAIMHIRRVSGLRDKHCNQGHRRTRFSLPAPCVHRGRGMAFTRSPH